MGTGWNRNTRQVWTSDEPPSSWWGLAAFVVVVGGLVAVVVWVWRSGGSSPF